MQTSTRINSRQERFAVRLAATTTASAEVGWGPQPDQPKRAAKHADAVGLHDLSTCATHPERAVTRIWYGCLQVIRWAIAISKLPSARRRGGAV